MVGRPLQSQPFVKECPTVCHRVAPVVGSWDRILLHQYRNLNFWLVERTRIVIVEGNKRNFEWKFALGVSIDKVPKDRRVLSMKYIEDGHPSLPDSRD